MFVDFRASFCRERSCGNEMENNVVLMLLTSSGFSIISTRSAILKSILLDCLFPCDLFHLDPFFKYTINDLLTGLLGPYQEIRSPIFFAVCKSEGFVFLVDDFLQKLKKVVCIVLYGLAISQSDCKKASLYQLSSNEDVHEMLLKVLTPLIWS